MSVVDSHERSLGRVEFIALLALSTALVALGIDIMLPALGAIRSDLGLPADSTAVAGLVTAYFLGLAFGHIGYGPVSDRFGRLPALYVGFAVYALGGLAAALSSSLPVLLVSRFVWGLGAAGPRVVTMAMIRDTSEGERMSRAMSFVMTVFLIVPVLAPSLGAAIVSVASWRWVFGACVVVVAAMSLWALRLPETLHAEHRLELRLTRVARAARFVVSDRGAMGYTLTLSALYGAFLSYIASSEIIFVQVFDRAESFPYIFGGLALFMGVAMMGNARIVGRVGTRRVAHTALVMYVGVAAVFTSINLATGGQPAFVVFLVCVVALISSHAVLIPNLFTLAMTDMAPVAGTASSVIGAAQIALGAVLGSVIDRAFDGTVLPLSLGFLGYGMIALVLVLVVEGGRLFRPLDRRPHPDLPPPPVAEA